MKRILLLIIVLFATTIINSQTDFIKGYIVKENRDTIYGLINYSDGNNNYRYCQFMDSEKVEGIAKAVFLPTTKSNVTGFQFVIGITTN